MMLDEIGGYLQTQGLGTIKTPSNNPTWPIYLGGVFPGTQDDAIALIEGPGDPPLDQMGATVGSVVAEAPSLVVQVRSSSYAVARTKAEAIWSKLHKYVGTLGSTRYLWIAARQSPFPVGRDDRDCWILGCNYDVMKERS